MCLYWEWRHFYSDVKKLCIKINGFFNRYRFGRAKIKYAGSARFKVCGRPFGGRRWRG